MLTINKISCKKSCKYAKKFLPLRCEKGTYRHRQNGNGKSLSEQLGQRVDRK